MDNIKLEASKSTPEVNFDFKNNIFEIKGQSYPENSQEFYNNLILSVEKYLEAPKINFELNIKLQYLNTSSTMYIMLLFEKLEDAFSKNKNIKVNWHYDKENELALECGEEFKEEITFPFNIILDN
jgi:hypothetical protein